MWENNIPDNETLVHVGERNYVSLLAAVNSYNKQYLFFCSVVKSVTYL